MSTKTYKYSHTVVGLFDDFQAAEAAVRDLSEAGIEKEQISLVARDRQAGTPRFGSVEEKTTDGTTVAENMIGGAAFGGLGGLVIGLAALAIPGIGPIIAAGPFAAMLGGATLGAVGGTVIGVIKDAGIPDDDAHFYAESIRRGGTVIMVGTSSAMSERTVEILSRHGAVNIEDRRADYQREGWSGFDEKAEVPQTVGSTASGDTLTIETSRRDKAADTGEARLSRHSLPRVYHTRT